MGLLPDKSRRPFDTIFYNITDPPFASEDRALTKGPVSELCLLEEDTLISQAGRRRAIYAKEVAMALKDRVGRPKE